MNKISLLSGILASILLLLILVPAFGWFALILWTACLVTVVTKSYQSLKTLLYTTVADAAVVRRAYGKLKELMNSRLPEEAADQKNGLP
ncbi:unnamed protein product [Prunus armeniaca]